MLGTGAQLQGTGCGMLEAGGCRGPARDRDSSLWRLAPPCAPQRTLDSEAMGARSEKDGMWAAAGVLLAAGAAPSGGLRRRARLSAHLKAKQWDQEARMMGCGRLLGICSWQAQLPLAACAAVRASAHT